MQNGVGVGSGLVEACVDPTNVDIDGVVAVVAVGNNGSASIVPAAVNIPRTSFLSCAYFQTVELI